MKTLEAGRLEFDSEHPDPDSVSARLDGLKRNHIDQLNWESFSYKPEAAFSIGYTSREIMLKYYISEDYFKAEKTESNQNVFEDSCVEFFLSPSDDGIYYNLEFNGIGTCLFGTGTSRENRIKADPQIIEKIRRISSAGKDPVAERKGKFTWTITVVIPVEVFFHHNLKTLKGRTFTANFYKCGDKLSVPHYLTWRPVRTSKPDFHRPEFFGTISFK
ncbi:MAG: carbohydrate-binding family 9-like protein [Bacteroidia bacterium]|nr:carbohydrate-binding family 9-like protein [Bacteroidia bacterium]